MGWSSWPRSPLRIDLFTAAITLLLIGALPLAISTWWSIATPVLAILAVVLGWMAIRTVASGPSLPGVHPLSDAP